MRELKVLFAVLVVLVIADYCYWILKVGIRRFTDMSLKDLYDNLRVSYYGCSLEVKDPFERAAIENKMQEMGIRYMKGYIEQLGLYSYSVIGTKRGKQKDLGELLEWFKGDGDLTYFRSTNIIFRTKSYCFMRKPAEAA